MFFYESESSSGCFIFVFILFSAYMQIMWPVIRHYNYQYPNLQIYHNSFIWSLYIIVFLLVSSVILKKIYAIRTLNKLKLKFNLGEDVTEAVQNIFITCVPISTLGFYIGFFIMPLILFHNVVKLGYVGISTVTLMSILFAGLILAYDLRLLFLTNKGIFGLLPFSKSFLSIDYKDIISVSVESPHFNVKKIILKTAKDNIEIRNYQNIDKLQKILDEKTNLSKTIDKEQAD